MKLLGKLIAHSFNIAEAIGRWLDKKVVTPMCEGFDDVDNKDEASHLNNSDSTTAYTVSMTACSLSAFHVSAKMENILGTSPNI